MEQGTLAEAISSATRLPSLTWLKDDAEAELAFEAEDGGDVVGAVGVVVDDAFAVEHFDEGLLAEIAGGAFADVVTGGGDLIAVGCGVDEELAHDGGGFVRGCPARGRCRASLVPLAIFMPPIGRPSASRMNISSMVPAGRGFDVDGLAAVEVAGAGHDVERGESAGEGAFESGVAGG